MMKGKKKKNGMVVFGEENKPRNTKQVIPVEIEETQEVQYLPDNPGDIFSNDKLVVAINDKLVTNSRLVAWKFGKQHKHVIDSIRDILSTAENSALLNYFQETSYTASNGKSNPMFVMNRDGFSLLVMGFTGQEVMKFKIEFIEAFNKMETIIKQPKFDVPQTYAQALRLAAEQQEQIEIQAAKIEADKPFNDYAKVIMENGKDMTMREFAILVQHELGIPSGKTGRGRIFEIYGYN